MAPIGTKEVQGEHNTSLRSDQRSPSPEQVFIILRNKRSPSPEYAPSALAETLWFTQYLLSDPKTVLE